MNRPQRRAVPARAHRSPPGRSPQAFKVWLAGQLANPPDQRLRPFLQTARDECEAANWRLSVVASQARGFGNG
jgi:hypothetical protein